MSGQLPGEEAVARLVETGRARRRLGDFRGASQAFERALALAPDLPALWLDLARLRFETGAYADAETLCDRAQAALQTLSAADRAAILTLKGRALQAMSRVDAAQGLWRQALDLAPDQFEACFALAAAALENGQWTEALRRVNPLCAPHGDQPDVCWLTARALLGLGEVDKAAALFSGLAATPGLSPPQKADALLWLAQALEGQKSHPAAFEAVREGKTILRRHYRQQALAGEGELQRLQRLDAAFSAARAEDWRGAGEPAGDEPPPPIFILGFPRSGTTLLEQILAGSDALVCLEEAPTLAEAAAEFLKNEKGLHRLAHLTPQEAKAWRDRYWRTAQACGVTLSGRRLVDKAPAASALLPLIAKLFPNAPILRAVRDPRAVILSCYFQNFQMNALTYGFTDLEETARIYAATQALFGRYAEVMTLNLTEVRHENLVADLAGETARICDFLGVGFEPKMLDFSSTASARIVRTPSAGQVRQGLDFKGGDRAASYVLELQSVLPILQPWITHFRY